MTSRQLTACSVLALCAVGCGARTPTAPSVARPLSTLSFEAEAGAGTGDRMARTSASGGLTIHLAPGQRREWTVDVVAPGADYVVMVRYSNDEIGEGETLTATVDGRPVGAFHAQDTGDDGAGWNAFVSDRAGAAALPAGRHVLTVESSGGDGCIEIDTVALVPGQGGA